MHQQHLLTDRRSDAGHIRIAQRDLELLPVVGEQFAITLPELARLLGRSEHAARWLRARWVEGRALLVSEPVFVWLTRPGQRRAGLPDKPWVPGMVRPHPGGHRRPLSVTPAARMRGEPTATEHSGCRSIAAFPSLPRHARRGGPRPRRTIFAGEH